MTREEIGEVLVEKNEEALMADGFEDAFIGIAQHFNRFCACYDYEKCIKVLIDRDGMTDDEAVEYFEYNVTGAWVGKFTPMFLSSDLDLEEIEETLIDCNEEALMVYGFEDALIGLVQQFNSYRACYDYDKCIKILVERDGMTEEEAKEHFDQKVACDGLGNEEVEEFLESELPSACLGYSYPVFLHPRS